MLIPIFAFAYTALQFMYIKRFASARAATANINAKRQVIIFVFAIGAICVMSGIAMVASVRAGLSEPALGMKTESLFLTYNVCVAIITMTGELEIMLTGVKEKENGRIKAL